MAGITPIASGIPEPVALRCVPDENRGIVLLRHGELVSIDLSSGSVTPLATGPSPSSGFDISPDRAFAYIATPRDGLWRVALDGSSSERLVRRLNNPRPVTVDPASGEVLVAETKAPGRLVAVVVAAPTASVVTTGLVGATAMVREQASKRTLVAETGGGGRISAVDGPDLPPVPVVLGVGAPADLAWADAGQRALVVADAGGGRVVLVDPSAPGSPATTLFEGIAGLWGVQPAGPGQFVIGAEDGLLLGVPSALDPVELHVPAEPLFVAAWTRVAVVVNDPAIAFDDLAFLVRPEEAAASVSLSRDSSFDPLRPEVVLIAGWMAGPHEIHAVHVPSGTTVASATFDVVDTWSDNEHGPSLSALGTVRSGPTAGTWGGGDFRSPQNLNVVPALGTRNVGVVLVDTADARYPTGAGLASTITRLRDEVANGVPVSGQRRSVTRYFDQVSAGAFGINLLDIVGPVSLPDRWGSYFDRVNRDDNGDGVTDWVLWDPKPSLEATVMSAIVRRNESAASSGGPTLLDLRQVDSLVIVVRSVPPGVAGPATFVWPSATLGPESHVVGWREIVPGVRLPHHRGIATAFMPDDWETQPRSGRRFHETLAHELGHNLQLNDQYFQRGSHDAVIRPRITNGGPDDSWELMSWEEGLPALSAAQRMMLGWIDPTKVALLNPAVFGRIDQTITLHAVSAGPVPAGRFAAAEVRIGNGRNYYFEYRPATPGRVVDPSPPAASTVFGSDVTSRGSTPATRPEILRLRDDSDADRSEFQTGDDYEETDTTSPQFPNDLLVEVLNTTADSARVRIRYGLDREPDPSLTPWSPRTNWQSPDLEVVNARSLADPAFHNVPWEGHDNTVVARVTNRGNLNALDVIVNFAAKDFTFGRGGAETSLASQVQDVPVGPPVTFRSPGVWRPAQLRFPFGRLQYQQHSCLVARITPYVNRGIVEITPDNNVAQSNYTWMASTTSSPSSREATVIVAENPYPVPAYVSFEVDQPHPLFRTYLSHRWVRLEPGATTKILVMVESAFGHPELESLVKEYDQADGRITTTLRLTSLGDTGESCAPEVIGGASIIAMAGRATKFERFQVDNGVASGHVATLDDGTGVDGPVLVTIQYDDQEKVSETRAVGGRFKVDVDDTPTSFVQGHYLGEWRFAPCDSNPVGG